MVIPYARDSRAQARRRRDAAFEGANVTQDVDTRIGRRDHHHRRSRRLHVEPIDEWLTRLEGALHGQRPLTVAGRTSEICRFLQVLTEILAPNSAEPAVATEPAWLARACTLLEADLTRDIDLRAIASQVAMPYETFRKRFQQQVGVSPGRYRATRRIDADRSAIFLPRPHGEGVTVGRQRDAGSK